MMAHQLASSSAKLASHFAIDLLTVVNLTVLQRNKDYAFLRVPLNRNNCFFCSATKPFVSKNYAVISCSSLCLPCALKAKDATYNIEYHGAMLSQFGRNVQKARINFNDCVFCSLTEILKVELVVTSLSKQCAPLWTTQH